MRKPGLLATTLLAGLTMAAVPARAQLGSLFGRPDPKPVLRQDKAGDIANIMRQGLIPPDVIAASLGALANGLVQGQSSSSTVNGVVYAWSIQGGPLPASGCRAVAGGWKRPEEAKPGFTAEGAWCWDSSGWYPKQVRIGGELAAAHVAQAPQKPAPAARPVVSGPAVRELDERRYSTVNGAIRIAMIPTSAMVQEFGPGTELHVTGEMQGTPWVRVTTRTGHVGYVLADSLSATRPAVAAQPVPSPTPPIAAAAVTIEDTDKPMMVVMDSPLKAGPDMASATLATLPLGTLVRATGIVHGPVAFVRITTPTGQTGFMLGGRIAPAPTLPAVAAAPPQAAPEAVAAAPVPLQPAPVQEAPKPSPAAREEVVQTPPTPAPPPVVVQAPVQPAPPSVVVQAPPPPSPVVTQANPAPALPAPPVVVAPPPAPPVPPKPKVKSDL